jgi:biopolymer transport protein ExbB
LIAHLVQQAVGVLVLAQDNTAKPAAESPKTLLDYIGSGGFIGMILIFLSIAAVTLLIMHLIQVRRTQLVPVDAATELQRLFRENDIQGAIRYCERGDSFLTRVFYAALTRCSRSPFGFMEIRSALEEAGQREADRLNRSTDLIGLIAAMGPMLGLLGTVIGMIGAFNSISALEGAARSRELAGFMALALVNTAEGLAVAIPCTAAFSILRRRLDRLISDAGEVIENLTVYIENPAGAERAGQRQARPAPAPAPRPLPTAMPQGIKTT